MRVIVVEPQPLDFHRELRFIEEFDFFLLFFVAGVSRWSISSVRLAIILLGSHSPEVNTEFAIAGELNLDIVGTFLC